MRDLLSEKGLPVNLEAERLVLGSILAGDLDIGIVRGMLTADDFGVEKHRRIWRSADDLYVAGSPVDRVTVATKLRDMGLLESVDGLSYLMSLDDGMPQLANPEAYIKLVKTKSTLRRGAMIASELMNRFLMATDEPGAVLADAERLIRDLNTESTESAGLRNFQQIIDGFGGLGSYTEKHDAGIQTPWPGLNAIIGGFRAGQMITLAGLTGSGKSAFGLQVAQHAAAHGYGTAVFSLEMSGQELFERLACGNAGVDSKKLERNRLERDERSAFQKAANDLTKLPLWIDDSTSCTLPAIHAALRRHMQQHEVKLLVVDYLQLVQPIGNKENRTQQVSELSRGMKLIAREYKIPVIVLAQLNRASEIEKREPQLRDLRESGSIGQDSDKVLFLHPIEPPVGTIPAGPLQVKLIIAKQRNGKTRRWVEMLFFDRNCRFEQMCSGEGMNAA